MDSRPDDREKMRIAALAEASRERAEALSKQLGELRGRPLVRWAERLDRRIQAVRPTQPHKLSARSPDQPVSPDAPWTITVAAPSPKVAPRWGDWWLAHGLAKSLRHHDLDVTVRTLAGPDPTGPGVHLAVRGLTATTRPADHAQILWVISHPESVSIAECDEADLVVVASEVFARWLAERTDTPVQVLLQATDADQFQPGPLVPAYAHDITVVAKTRDQFRPAVATAVAAGLKPAVYGSGWARFVEPSLIRADHIDHSELPAVYRSSRVVLNDHWDTMRLWGFVSNRIFDVSACGTPVASDAMPEIDDLFKGSVPTWTDADSLLAIVGRSDADLRQTGEQARSIVTEHHTFANRAAELLDQAVAAGVLAGHPGRPR